MRDRTRAKVCLLTPGQPSNNPRLLKEADALAEAGYDVQVICAHCVPWADAGDRELLARRAWTCAYVGGRVERGGLHHRATRLRYGLTRRAARFWPGPRFLDLWRLSRVTPELIRAAQRRRCDLYIAHYLGALPAAVAAARRYGTRAAFDAEDFHSGSGEEGGSRSGAPSLAERIEKAYLPQCDSITASSPGIAAAYAEQYQLPLPATVLNVFPLSYRPQRLPRPAPDGPLTLYWFSQTIGAGRGLEEVVQSMGRLRGCPIVLHLRGSWHPGYREQLMRTAATAGVAAGQIVAHGMAPPEEMVRLAAEYDIGLALEPGVNKNNGLAVSNKLFTYLLAGNAVIATATPGQRPLMETLDGAGYCYRIGDQEALAQILRRWYADRAALDAARRQSWEYGTCRYNWDLEKRRFLGVVEEVLGAPAGVHP